MEKSKNYKKSIKIILFLTFLTAIYIVFMNRSQIGAVLVPFIIGGIIAYLLEPLVMGLQKRKVPRWAAILLIGLLFIIFTAGFLNYFIPKLYLNISELITNIPVYTDEYNKRFNSFQAEVNYSSLPEQVKEIIISQIKGNISSLQNLFLVSLKNSLGAINSIFSFLFNFILGIFIALYILKDRDYLKAQVTSLLPRKWRAGVISTAGEINVIIGSYIQGQLLIIMMVSILEIIGLSIVGVKYAFVLGLVGGVANVIPYFGPFIGAVPAVAMALLDSPIKALFAVLVFIIVQQIDNVLITPRIMSQKIGLHPLLIIFVVLLGGSLFGMIGLLLAVPVTAVIKVIGKKVIEKIV